VALNLYPSWRDAPQTPPGWKPARPPGHRLKAAVHHAELKKMLQAALPGRWSKVYHKGADGTELHYFEHESGRVFNVKHVDKRR